MANAARIATVPASVFEQVFTNVDNVLRRESGCTTELDYTEQTSWLLFLDNLEWLEQDRATTAELEGMGIIKNQPLELPPIEQQRVVAARLASIRDGVQDIETVGRRKLAALTDLEKSLLHQAFTGAL